MTGNATCYDPQHRPGLESDKYEACWSGTSDGFSTCCPQGWTCLKNLLCVYTGTNQKQLPKGTLQRGLCTDETFKSENCPQFCLGGDNNRNNGTTIKNCGNGTGCCHDNTSKDCSCDAGSPGALLLEIQRVVSNTAKPTTPVTALLLGSTSSVSTPASVTTTLSSSFQSTVVSTSTQTTKISTPTTRARLTPSSLTASMPTTYNIAAVSTMIPAVANASPSPAAITSPGISNLGLIVGLPLGIVIVVASLITAFFLFRRHTRDNKKDHHEADVLPMRQWPQNKEEYEIQKWDYKTVPPPKYSPRSRPLMCDKPLPIPGDQVSEKKSSNPFEMHELPSDDWLAKELPGSPHPSEYQRYELG